MIRILSAGFEIHGFVDQRPSSIEFSNCEIKIDPPSFKIETQTPKKVNSEQGKERRGKHGPDEKKKTVESAWSWVMGGINSDEGGANLV